MTLHFRLLVLGFAIAIAAPATAADWPRFRGPNGSGISTENAPTQFTKDNLAWKTEIPGIGHSSPIIVGKKVFIQTASKDGATRSMICIDADTGKMLWNQNVPGATSKIHKKNSLASGTPVSDGTIVAGTFWDGDKVSLAAFDMEGKSLWTAELGGFASQHGPGHSPIIVKGLVIVNFDQDPSAKLVAFDAKTGKEKWSVDREKYRASYSTPIVTERDGKTELIVGTITSIDGYAPETGKVVWSYPIKWASGGMPLRAVAGPVLSDDYISLAMGDGGGSRYMLTIQPGKDGAKKIWDAKKDTPYVPNQIAYEGYLYWLHDAGLAVCADAKTGKVQWSERVIQRGAISSSPILVKDTMLIIAEDGTAVSFKASPKGLEKVGESKVGEAVFSTPAVADGKLFIRGATHLFCYAQKGS